MKKILLLAAGLMIAGSSFACDKDKAANCNKTAKENCKEKSCCKKGSSSTSSSSKSTKTTTTAKNETAKK